MPRTAPEPVVRDGTVHHRKTGRPSSFKPEYYHLAEVAARRGLTHEGIAELLGVRPDCISKWKGEDDEFTRVIKKGEDHYNNKRVVTALRERALGYEFDEIHEEYILIRKNGEDKMYIEKKETQGRNGDKHIRTSLVEGRKIKIVHKKIPPSDIAIIFWLCNRMPDEWANVQRQLVEGNVNHKHKVEGNVVLDLAGLGKEKLEQLRNIVADAEGNGKAKVIDLDKNGRLRLGAGKPKRVPAAALANG